MDLTQIYADFANALSTGQPLSSGTVNTAAAAQAPVVVDPTTGASTSSGFWNFLTGALGTAGSVYTAANQTDAQKTAAAGTAAQAALTAANAQAAASKNNLLLLGAGVLTVVLVVLVFLRGRK